MELTWLTPGGERHDHRCPVCDSSAPKPAVLRISAFIGGDVLTLLACPGCTSLFYDDMAVHKYEELEIDGGFAERYYLEQGAGLDWLARMLYQVERHQIAHFLEIGCGYGLSLDYASQVFGWRSKGIDPSPLAALGSRTLGLDIEARYLEVGERLEGPLCDLLFCSEVIEHVPDPRAFVNTLRAQMAPGACLMLTTPNAKAVVPDSPMLQPVLSAGKHLILFTQASLQRLLQQAGFQHVVVEETRDTLRAFASSRPLPPAVGEVALDTTQFQAYLARRADDFPPGHPMSLGYRYRLFKALVNEGRYATANDVFQAMVPVLQETFGLELPRASEHLAPLLKAPWYEALGHVPFNLTGWLFFKGIIEINTNPDKDVAATYFDAALQAGLLLRACFATFEMEDGEIENLSKLARLHAIFCQADTHLESGLDELARIRSLPPGLAAFERQWVVSDAEEADFQARFAARYPHAGPKEGGLVRTGWLHAARRWFGRA